ncbi:MAG: TetR family transcriptional regulator [Ornithinimicrobium sp.]
MTGSTKRTHMPVAERRAQLVQAAQSVMLREGAWALTTRAVAAEAGVPLGAVHYAFDSKGALISAVFGADIASVAAVVSEAMSRGGTPEEIIRRAVQRYAEELRRDPKAELVVQELGLMGVRDAELAHLAAEAVTGYRAEIVSFLDGVAAVEGRQWQAPVTVIAEVFFGQLVGLAQNWLCTSDDELLDACLDEVAHQLARRLLPA